MLSTLWTMAEGRRKESRRRLIDFIRVFNDSDMTLGKALRYVQTGDLDDAPAGVPGSTDTEMPPEAMAALTKMGWMKGE